MAAVDDHDPVAFTVVRHGYDRDQVRQRMDELTAALERATSDRDEAVAQAAEFQGELEIARREIAAMAERLETHGGEESTARMLAVAKAQAAEVTSRAKVAAEQTWSEAEKASADVREHYRTMLRDLEEQHAELNRAHKAMMSAARAKTEKMTVEAERRQEAIDKAAERDRIRIDREFSESIATKRDALRRELDKAKAESEREVLTRLTAADEEARRRVETVTEQVKQLSAVREQLSARLRETKELLDLSTALMAPVDGESEAEEPAPKTKDKVPPQRQPAKR